MSTATYADLLDLAAGALVLTAVFVVWRREVRAMIKLLIAQALALSAVPLLEGLHTHDAALIGIAAVVFAVRVVLLPWLVSRAVASLPGEQRESTPLVNTTASLLIAAVLSLIAFAVGRPLVAIDASAATRAAPGALAVVFVAVFVIVSRRHAVSQAVGFLMLDNGIAATAFLTTAGVPSIVELGASLDVLFAVLVLGVLTGRLQRTFGDTDLDQLRELRD